MSTRQRPALRCGLRSLLRALSFAGGVAVAWLALALHPEPLFAYSAVRANVVLHAREPLPPETGPLLDEVVRRIARSPLYDSARTQHVFLCGSKAVYGLFALRKYRTGGLAQVALTGNVFIRPADVSKNQVFGPSGVVKEGERTLTYFIAHELTHAMVGDRIGRRRFLQLAAFQNEGYADYVAFAHTLDLRKARAALERDDPKMSPARSGLYKRYELLADYLLERRGFSVEALLAKPLDRRAVEAELLHDPSL